MTHAVNALLNPLINIHSLLATNQGLQNPVVWGEVQVMQKSNIEKNFLIKLYRDKDFFTRPKKIFIAECALKSKL